MPAPTEPHSRSHPLPADVADVALTDAKTCAGVGAVSLSFWYGEVAAGRAPAPVIRKPRFTRWRVADVRAFWLRVAEQGNDDAQVIARATKASEAAQAKRAAERVGQ